MSTFTTSPPSGASILIRGAAQLWDGWRIWNDFSVLIVGSRVAWMGPHAAAPPADEVLDVPGGLVMPGLVDCHTHLVHAGTRVGDFLRRMDGAGFAELLEGTRGTMFRLGVAGPQGCSPLHSNSFAPDEDCLAVGVKVLSLSLLRWLADPV